MYKVVYIKDQSDTTITIDKKHTKGEASWAALNGKWQHCI